LNQDQNPGWRFVLAVFNFIKKFIELQTAPVKKHHHWLGRLQKILCKLLAFTCAQHVTAYRVELDVSSLQVSQLADELSSWLPPLALGR